MSHQNAYRSVEEYRRLLREELDRMYREACRAETNRKPQAATMSYQSWIEGPRFMGRLDWWLQNLAHQLGLSITVQRQTSLLRQRVEYTVSGPSEGIRRFQAAIRDLVND
ncbi:MAG: hypothetical protein GXP27_00805 [Planctomycetes bacterium]|nr:hypothetical protein [Planctomycetota bacterium]